MTRSQTVQTRLDPDLYEKLLLICELRNETQSEYLRNSLKEALIKEPKVYKLMMKREKGRK